MAVNWTDIKRAANLAIPVPPLHGDITFAGETPLTGAFPVLLVNWTVIWGVALANLAIPVPLLLWRLLLVPHLFPCSSTDCTMVFCIDQRPPKAPSIMMSHQCKMFDVAPFPCGGRLANSAYYHIHSGISLACHTPPYPQLTQNRKLSLNRKIGIYYIRHKSASVGDIYKLCTKKKYSRGWACILSSLKAQSHPKLSSKSVDPTWMTK